MIIDLPYIPQKRNRYFIYSNTLIQESIYIFLHALAGTHTYTHICMCVCVCVCVCMYVWMDGWMDSIFL